MAMRDVSKTDISRSLRVETRTVTNWLKGKTQPVASHITALCNLLDVSGDFLLGRREHPHGLPTGKVIVNLDAEEAVRRATRLGGDISQVSFAAIGYEIPPRVRLVSREESEEIVKSIEPRGEQQ